MSRRQRAAQRQRRWGGGARRPGQQDPDFGSNAERQEEVRRATPAPTPAPAPAAPARRPAAAAPAAAAPAITDAALAEATRTTLDPQLAVLGASSSTDKQRQAAATATAGFTRQNLVDPMAVQRFLARTDVSADEKTAALGQLSVAAARAEFLSGWAYEGGVGNGGGNGWENAGGNRGVFPSHYQDTVQTHGRGSGAEWCTSFAGSMWKAAGMRTPSGVSGEEANSPFWSGFRLNTWAETGETVAGQQATPVGERVAAGQNGAQYVPADRWAGLRSSLRGARDDTGRAAAASAFTGQFGIQPGDVMVLGSGNDYRSNSKSHTVMVESFDPETMTLTTIEGNAGNAVSSRRIDLRNQSDVAQIVSSVRPGFDQYLDPAAQERIAQETEAGTAPAPVAADDLVARANGLTAHVAAPLAAAGLIHGEATDSAYVWQHGDGEAGELSVN
jgi:hypothetical protein